eukprot:359135-Chlamydomonas_euryale.AAC.3
MGIGGIGDGQNWAFIIDVSCKIGDDLVRRSLQNHTDWGRLGMDHQRLPERHICTNCLGRSFVQRLPLHVSRRPCAYPRGTLHTPCCTN